MIVVFGSINLDLVTAVPNIAAPGETVLGESYARVPGGKGANQALAARRAGSEVALVGAAGHDDFADAALSLLAEAGVDLGAVARVEAPTGAAFIAVDAEGQNAITVAAGANARVTGMQLQDMALGAGDLLLLQREVPDRESEAAARIAKGRGARVILNLAPAGRISDAFLATIDLLVMNEDEAKSLAKALGGESEPAAFAETLERRFGIGSVITLGPAGVYGRLDGAEHRSRAPAITVVDTTGAGDTFVGAFAAALDAGLSFGQALARGTVAGSLACTRAGAQPSIPTKAEIDAASA